MRTLLLPPALAVIFLCPLPVTAQAQPAPPLTLEQAQTLAASRSFDITAARRGLDAAEGAVRQAGAARNPALTASVEDTRHATRVTTATLDVPFELGGRRHARVTAAERSRDIAQAELGQAQARLRAAVIGAYVAVLVAQERVALAGSSADLAARSADATARRVAAGKVSPIDETRARVDQSNALLEATEATAEWQAARQALAALWGDPEADFPPVVGDLSELPVRGTAAELAPQLVASPGLLLSRLAAEQRRALVDVERSRGVPDISVSVGARRDNGLGRTQAIVGVSVPLPLFDRNQGAIHEAAQRAEQADDEHQAARIRALTELQTAARRLAVARSTAQALRATVLPAARQAHEAATVAFEAGKFGFLDVIDAQRSLIRARSRHLDAVSAAHQAASTIDRLLGR